LWTMHQHAELLLNACQGISDIAQSPRLL